MIALDPTALGCFATLIIAGLVLLGALMRAQARIRAYELADEMRRQRAQELIAHRRKA